MATVARRCMDCPGRVVAVCRHAFGGYWGARSGGGEGCLHPLDDVAEAWREAGWTPDAPETREKARRTVPLGGGVIALDCPADAPRAASRASGAMPARKFPAMPVRPSRPRVSPEILRQARLFFGGAA